MKQVIRATCPGCQRLLKIPADYMEQTIRCKQCGTALQPQKKPIAVADAKPAEKKSTEKKPAEKKSAPGKNIPAPIIEEFVEDTTFEPVPTVAKSSSKYRGPAKGGLVKWLVVLFFVSLLGTAAGVVVLKPEWLTKPIAPTSDQVKEDSKRIPGKAGPFPRRLLSININNYLYANPVHYGNSRPLVVTSRTDVHSVMDRLSDRWRIPREQIYELTDGPTTEVAKNYRLPPERLPMKDVVLGTIKRFCESSRAQDRIVFLFTGHAVEKEGQVYLVPIEGELDTIESLIPLKNVYELFGSCAAQEKLIIWDVCRFDPGRGTERPIFGVMTEAMEKAFHSPPETVSVWTACSKGQYSMEYDGEEFGSGRDKTVLSGSVFLNLFLLASREGTLSAEPKNSTLQNPEEPLPIEPLVTFINKKTAETIKYLDETRQQSPKYTAATKTTTVAYDPNEPPPGRMELPTPPAGADKQDIAAIFKEIEIPAIRIVGTKLADSRNNLNYIFTEAAMKEYRSDGISTAEIKSNPEKFPVRLAILDVVQSLQKLQNDKGDLLRETLPGTISDALKKDILDNVQRTAAKRMSVVMEAHEKLNQAHQVRDKEISKRWQAHLDYLRAEVLFHLAYIEEYNLAMGKIRKDELPVLEKNQSSYRLTAVEKMKSPKENRDRVDEARALLEEVQKNHPNTPWAVLAKRDKGMALGLEWKGVGSNDDK